MGSNRERGTVTANRRRPFHVLKKNASLTARAKAARKKCLEDNSRTRQKRRGMDASRPWFHCRANDDRRGGREEFMVRADEGGWEMGP